MCVGYHNGDVDFYKWTKDKWTIAFSEGLLMRPSCDDCKFKQSSEFHYADISAGDFWGVENNAPELFHPAGVSAVLAQSAKGLRWIERLRNDMDIRPVDISKIRRGNPSVWKSCKPNPGRTAFLRELEKDGTDFGILVGRFLGIQGQENGDELKIGVLGGFNLRKAVIDACGMCNGTMEFHISNSSLVSLMASEVVMPETIRLPKNILRADMIKLDFEKFLFKNEPAQRVKGIDYFVIDFMEERFDIIPYEGSYITFSDALSDSSFTVEKKIAREEKALKEIWEKSCLQFISFLEKYYSKERIILVKSYLSYQYEEDDGEFVEFDKMQLQYSIETINKALNRYYDFFLAHYTPGAVIAVDSSLLYCENNHKHGVMPSHANSKMCWEVTKQICQIIEYRKKLGCKGVKNEFIL